MGFLKDKPKALHAFRVVTKGHIYLLCARSAALKQDWVKVIVLPSSPLIPSTPPQHTVGTGYHVGRAATCPITELELSRTFTA